MIFEDTKELFETQVLENKVKIFGDCVFVIVIVKKYCRCLSTIVIFQVLEYKAKNKRTKETLLTCLADLFYSIVTQKRKVYFARMMMMMTKTMMMMAVMMFMTMTLLTCLADVFYSIVTQKRKVG